MNEIAAEGRIGFLWSMLVVYGIGGLFLGTLLWLATAQMLRLLSRARLARRIAILEAKPLEEGPAVLRGKVELDEDDSRTDAPVRLVVFQDGKELKGKNGTSHTWTETRREISYRPFYLRLPSQERLRIFPNARTMLADGLDTTERIDATHRAAIAELAVGEEVIASGIIKREKATVGEGGGYRGGGTVMVMRAPPGQKLLLSTGPLAERFEQSASHYRFYAVILALFTMLVHGVGFADFHQLNARGEVVRGAFVETDTYTTKTKKNTTLHYRVRAVGPNGEELSSDVDENTYFAAQAWVTVPFVVVLSSPTIHTIGTEPRIKRLSAAFFLSVLFSALLLYRFFPGVQKRLPWYERRKIVDQGPGVL